MFSSEEQIDVFGNALNDAALYGWKNTVQAILTDFPSVIETIYARRALNNASKKGHTDIVLCLLKAGVDPNAAGGGFHLNDAVAGNHIETAWLLLEHGANMERLDTQVQTQPMTELLQTYVQLRKQGKLGSFPQPL